jgi:hypothetical protein
MRRRVQGARHRETAEKSSRLTPFALCLKPVTYASFLSISDALHLSIFQQPPEPGFSDRLLALGKDREGKLASEKQKAHLSWRDRLQVLKPTGNALAYAVQCMATPQLGLKH